MHFRFQQLERLENRRLFATLAGEVDTTLAADVSTDFTDSTIAETTFTTERDSAVNWDTRGTSDTRDVTVDDWFN